jgi:hypothetical protein
VFSLYKVNKMRSKEEWRLFSVRMLINFGSESPKRIAVITTVWAVCSKSVLLEYNSPLDVPNRNFSVF